MTLAPGGSLGTPVTNTGAQSTSIAFTTNVAVPANSVLVVGVSSYNAGVTTTVADNGAGGSLSWAAGTAHVDGAVDANHHLYLFRANAPSGLASGATITATFSGAAFGRAIFGFYLTAAAAAALDGTPATGAGNLSSPAWSTGSISDRAATSGMIVAVAWGDQITSSSTPSATTPTTTEGLDFNNGSDATWTLAYRVLTDANAYNVSGAFANSNTGNDWLAVAIALKEAGGTDATVTSPAVDAAGDIPAPVVTADAAVTSPPVDAAGDIPSPAVVADANVVAPPVDGTGDMPDPVISGGGSATVTSPAAAGAGDIPAPAVSADANVTAPPAAGAGDLPAAAMDLSAEVQTGPLSGTGDIPSPTVTGVSNIDAPPADGTGDIPAPAISAGANVTATPLDGTGDILAPTVSGGGAGGGFVISRPINAPLNGASVTPRAGAGAQVPAKPARGAHVTAKPARAAHITKPARGAHVTAKPHAGATVPEKPPAGATVAG